MIYAARQNVVERRCSRRVLLIMPSKKPSQVKDQYWIHVESPGAAWGKSPGKWLLFISMTRLDIVWPVIERETEGGRLGAAAKVSTSKSNPLSTNSSTGLICVYTYDSDDLTDVLRVRQRLRELGFKRKIPYKTDMQTDDGRYLAEGHKNVSMLFE